MAVEKTPDELGGRDIGGAEEERKCRQTKRENEQRKGDARGRTSADREPNSPVLSCCHAVHRRLFSPARAGPLASRSIWPPARGRSTRDGRFPGSRLLARSPRLPGCPVACGGSLAAHSCGGSRGVESRVPLTVALGKLLVRGLLGRKRTGFSAQFRQRLRAFRRPRAGTEKRGQRDPLDKRAVRQRS